MTLTLELNANVEARLTQAAQKQNLSLPAYLETLLEKFVVETNKDLGGSAVSEEDPLITLTQEIIASVPAEEWENTPVDYAMRYKQYHQTWKREAK